MLGWSFSVSTENHPNLAYWTGGIDSDHWLMDAIIENKAKLILETGGYPDIYEVKPEAIPTDKYVFLPVVDWCIVEVWDQS